MFGCCRDEAEGWRANVAVTIIDICQVVAAGAIIGAPGNAVQRSAVQGALVPDAAPAGL